jgi:hypothetical protein
VSQLRTRLARDRRNQQPAPWCWFGAELELDSQRRKDFDGRLADCYAARDLDEATLTQAIFG